MMKRSGNRVIDRKNLNPIKDKANKAEADAVTDCRVIAPIEDPLLAVVQGSDERWHSRCVTLEQEGHRTGLIDTKLLKIAMLREAIATGVYRIDSRRIAARMLQQESQFFV